MNRIFRTLCVCKGNRVGLRKLPNYYFSQILAYIFLLLFQLHIHLLSKIKKNVNIYLCQNKSPCKTRQAMEVSRYLTLCRIRGLI